MPLAQSFLYYSPVCATMGRFDYLLEKIRQAEFSLDPFRHIYIEDFFSEDDFKEITSSPEISPRRVASDRELFDELASLGYAIVEFPGCVEDRDTYIRWHNNRDREPVVNATSCEGFGVVFRMVKSASPVVSELMGFFSGAEFNRALAEKLSVPFDDCYIDGGVQKYLDGYEISPHPDVRKKALTFMVNINPHSDSQEKNHHTHYLKFKGKWQYVQRFWEKNLDFDRGWVPWGWCDTVKEQKKNNSIVVFSPSNDTLHAVKAGYDHLDGQRTQIYGNLWYRNAPKLRGIKWEDLGDMVTAPTPNSRSS